MTTGSKAWGNSTVGGRKTWSGSDDPTKSLDNAYTMTGERWDLSAVYCSTASSCWASPIPFEGDNTLLSDNGQKLDALNKCIEKLKGHDFDLGNFAAEAGSVAEQAFGALSSIAAAARALKKGDLAKAARALGMNSRKSVTSSPDVQRAIDRAARGSLNSKDISGQWLGLAYGWLPLLGDVYEASQALAAKTNGPRTLSVKARSRRTATWGSNSASGRWVTYKSLSVEARVTVSEQLNTYRELGLMDPLGVAWELVPYSFVVDWFLPIGDYLNALNFFAGTNATVSYSTRLINESRCLYKPPPPYGYKSYAGYYKYLRLYRDARVPVVVPAPRLQSFSEVFSPMRFANAIALGHQAFGK